MIRIRMRFMSDVFGYITKINELCKTGDAKKN
jgi:hypothetical protein